MLAKGNDIIWSFMGELSDSTSTQEEIQTLFVSSKMLWIR